MRNEESRAQSSFNSNHGKEIDQSWIQDYSGKRSSKNLWWWRVRKVSRIAHLREWKRVQQLEIILEFVARGREIAEQAGNLAVFWSILSYPTLPPRVGCTLAPHNTWTSLPPSIPIIGLKELPLPGPPLPNTHIQFAHCYKHQAGWVDVLSRFKTGGGKLYDLEFLEDESGRRVAAFGWHAGFAGAALGLLALAEQIKDPKKRLGPQTRYPNEGELIKHARMEIEEIKKGRKDGKVKALVVGALGRCGRGAIDFFQKAGVQEWVFFWVVEKGLEVRLYRMED